MIMSGDAVPLRFTDLQSGLDYLRQLPLTNPLLAERALDRFLDSLITDPPDVQTLLTLLEHAREPLHFVEEELARSYLNKALVLTEKEESCFRQVVASWRKMRAGYVLCGNLSGRDAMLPQDAGLWAGILHRCLYYTGLIIIEHYRARRELPDGIWLELHAYFEKAEALNVAYVPVEDALENNFQASHCAAAFSALLLIDLASPYSNSIRNLNLIRRWAAMWTPLVSVQRIDDETEIPPYVVEYRKDLPMHPAGTTEEPGADARRLDTTRLGLQLQHMLSQLRHRISPSELGLGEETPGHVKQLLEQLVRPWTQAASPRRFRRFATEGVASVATGFEAMHLCVSGRSFHQPANSDTYTRGEFDQLFTFRDRVNANQSLTIAPEPDLPAEQWEVINHSASGFRLASSQPVQKLIHGQLVAIRPHDGDRFLLAYATWLMQENAGGLMLGLATLPGMPAGVGVRRSGPKGMALEKFVRAFLLPAMPAIKEEGSLVLPSGLYQASRVLDVLSAGTVVQLQMNSVLQRGTDFDRVSFLAV